jgi:hypothetical protein
VAHALRALSAPGEHAYQGLGVTHIVEQALFLQLGNGGGDDGRVIALAEQGRRGLAGGIFAPRY